MPASTQCWQFHDRVRLSMGVPVMTEISCCSGRANYGSHRGLLDKLPALCRVGSWKLLEAEESCRTSDMEQNTCRLVVFG